jgi:ribonuclease Z
MKTSISVLTTRSLETMPSFILHAEKSSYLFNCGENTQRAFNEYKHRITRISATFITRNSWNVFGGYPGLMMTMADSDLKNTRLFGPDKIGHLVSSLKGSVSRYFLIS